MTHEVDPREDVIEVFEAADSGDWRWHRRAVNGEIICQGEGHTSEHDAWRAARRATEVGLAFDEDHRQLRH